MKKIIVALVTTLSLLTVSCSSDDGFQPPQDLEIHDFVWKAMNHWYFWQEDVIDLSDDKDANESDYLEYLRGFNDAETLFESLRFSADDFSWYISDVEAQLNAFRGISESYGIGLPSNIVRVQQGSDDIVIFVAYVVPGSPADLAGIQRGDLIYKVNGTVLNTGNANLINGIFNDPTISLGIAEFENGNLNPKGNDRALTAVLLSQNPVHYSSIIEEDGLKIGYLVYNGFRSTFHPELNAVFENFKSQNVDALVLDLRYNRGGSVLTSSYLASMIEGSKPDGDPFASLTYNAKRNAVNESVYDFSDEAAIFDKQTGEFTNSYLTTSRLTNLDKVYILTTRSTASASEMIINGLRPSMEVVIVGATTTGKNEGSITLVDAPSRGNIQAFSDVDNRNANHTVGLQPIVFQIFNSLGQSDYADGFAPTIEIDELDFTATILPFGETDEPLLKAAINDITGATKAIQVPLTKVQQLEKRPYKKFSDAMYILPAELENSTNQ